jgi:3-oxoacyl-[acyl-carrier protein] reductase
MELLTYVLERPRGVTINNVQPGPVDTDMNPASTDFAEML